MSISPKTVIKETVNKAGTLLLSPPYGGVGFFRNHGPRNSRKIALTFDDGPSRPCTELLLDAMANLQVKGTFFCVGVNVQWHPELVERAYQEGHNIGCHSMRHSRKAGLLLKDSGHIEEAAQEIAAVIGREPKLYRPPWGWLTPWEGRRLTRKGFTIVGWDVYTHDWVWPEPAGELTAAEAIESTKGGSIVLFHDANAGVKEWDKRQTTKAVEIYVKAMRAKGYEFVTVEELLGVEAYGESSRMLVGAH